MNKKYIIGTGLLSTLLVATVSCSSDLAESLTTENGGKVWVTATATSNKDAQTRVAFGGDNNLSLHWQDGDKIGIKVDGAQASALALTEGAGTTSATFAGEMIPSSKNVEMYACYPETSFGGTDLTTQSGLPSDASKRLVMYASAGYSTSPSFSFDTKVSVLKLGMRIPEGVTSISKVVIEGAYATGTLGTDGEWTNLKVADITLSSASIENNKVVGYAVVIPGTLVKNLSILVSTDKGDYRTRAYTHETAKIANNQKIEISESLVQVLYYKYKLSFTIEDYFYWDAYSYVTNGENLFSEGNYGCNPITSGSASYSCASCPTASQMIAYLRAGVYWDDNTTVTDGQLTYSAPVSGSDVSSGAMKTNYHTGLWLKKRDKIKDFDTVTGTSVTVTPTKLSTLTNQQVRDIRTSGDYFFLPAVGSFSNNSFVAVGDEGIYWLSTIGLYYEYHSPCVLWLKNDYVYVLSAPSREKGYLLMSVE